MLSLGVFSLSSVDLLATAVPVRRLNFPACGSVAPDTGENLDRFASPGEITFLSVSDPFLHTPAYVNQPMPKTSFRTTRTIPVSPSEVYARNVYTRGNRGPQLGSYRKRRDIHRSHDSPPVNHYVTVPSEIAFQYFPYFRLFVRIYTRTPLLTPLYYPLWHHYSSSGGGHRV